MGITVLSDSESDLDEFGDYDDGSEVDFSNEHSDAESGFEEPTTSTSIDVSESLQDAVNRCLLDRVNELIPLIDNYKTFKLKNDLKPLQYAAQLGKPELVRYFLDLETDSADYCQLIPSPLSLACSISHENVNEDYLKCVELLLDAGMDVNFQDLYGVSPLMKACENGKLETIHLLLSRGARVNDCNNDGWSALFYAANQASTEIVEKILEHGADLEKKDKRGRYPYTIACEKGFTKIAELITPKALIKDEHMSMDTVNVGKISLVSEVLNGNDPDFFEDVFEMLSGVVSRMERYASLFRDKKINLRQFLLLKNEDELKGIGIPFFWYRQTIIARLRQYHLGSWFPHSLVFDFVEENANQSNQITKLFIYMSTLRQQMIVVKTSLEYLLDDVLIFVREDPQKARILLSIRTKLQSIILRIKLVRERLSFEKASYKSRLLVQQVETW